jgi:1-acyl-sn-glycerol-3-phosphate acyltransferase
VNAVDRWTVPGPALSPIEPSAEALERMNTFLARSGWLFRLALRPWVQGVDVQGLEHLATGPRLVMMNHSSVFDPLLLQFFTRRPIQLLVTEPFMTTGVPARIARWWGQIPKRKLESDTRSLRTLKGWCRVGGAAGLFPEGEFPWDGHPLPMQPGLGQLISYVEAPLVTVRVINGDRLWPPWAKHPRRTKLRMEIDPPKRFEPGEPIEPYVVSRLHVDPETCPRWPAHGKRLAEGMTKFLRHCPECGADASLSDEGDELACASCKRRWTVTSDNRLHRGGEVMTIAEVRRRVSAHWSERWRRDRAYRSRGPVNVIDVSRAETVHVATGELHLDSGGRLRVGDWQLDLRTLLAHTMDWGDRIVLRTQRQRLALRMPHDSRAIWTFAIDEALKEGTSREVAGA